VWGKVDFHVKDATKHIQDIQELLHLQRAVAYEGDIVSIHYVWDTQAIQNRACTRQLHLDHVVEQFYK
jgi:hypothetical protein